MATAERSKSGVSNRRWSKVEYYQMADLGFFRGQRVELLEGRIVVMSPQNPPHAFHVDRAVRVLNGIFGQGYCVRMQLPLDIGQTSEPEPDISVVAGAPDQFRTAHPTGAVLIVEVSDTTVSYDRRRKGSLYARSGIGDYWIINLQDGWLEVYRDPIPDASWHYGYRYSLRTDLLPTSTVIPRATPGMAINLADLVG